MMRYRSADDYIEAQKAMTVYSDAADIAEKQAVKEPGGVCVIVRIVTVVPGKAAPLIMNTMGEA